MRNEITTRREEINNYEKELEKEILKKNLEEKRRQKIMLEEFAVDEEKLMALYEEGTISLDVYNERLKELDKIKEKTQAQLDKDREKKEKSIYSERKNIEKERVKLEKDLASNMDSLSSSFEKATSFAKETGELTNLKMEQTIKNIQSIEVLENIIMNPDYKMADIIKSKGIDYNGIELELFISFTQFLLNKDKAIHKNGKGYENLLLDVLVEYKDDKEAIKNFTETTNIIRNTIGHGKFTVDHDNLEIKFDNGTKNIAYKDIKNLMDSYFVNNEQNINKLPINTGFVVNTYNENLNINNFSNQIGNFTMCDINITNTKEDYDIEVLSKIQRNIADIKNGNIKDIEAIKRTINGAIMASSFAGLKIECNTYKLSDAKNNLQNNILKIVEENIDALKNRDSKVLENFLNGCVNDLYYDSKAALQLDKALSQIKKLALYTHTDKDLTYNQIKDTKKDLPPTDNQMLVATTLVKYNMLYSYNNETIFKKGLDFSKIDLSELKPTINKDMDTTYKAYNEKVNELYKSIDVDNKKYEGCLHYTPLLEERKNINNLKMYGRLFMLLDNEYLYKMEKYDFKEDIVDKEKYIENKNIFMHIRNSITHGNVTIDNRLKNNDLRTCILTFNDYNEGEKTFELTTTLDKIVALNNYNELFNMLNREQIINYNYPGNTKVYSGFTNLVTFIAIVSIESIALLFYVLLKTGII